MAAHVYDHNLQRLLTIAVCEMKLENTENQIKFWNLLNNAVMKRGMPKPKFKGFMADAAPANYNAVRAVYGLVEGLDGNPDDVERDDPNPDNPILRTCYFHFVQSIRDHTNKWVLEKYRVHHVEMCKRWASAPTNQEFRQIAEELEEWWQTSGAVQKCNVKFMLAWKTWWMARRTLFAYHHVNELDLDLESEALIPTTNLCEPVHSSMWATSACGYKVKMDLYTVCAEDMTRSLLQQQFCLGASKGQLKGSGPSKADLLLRSAARSHRPEKVAMAVKAAVKGTEFHSRGVGLEGELDRTQSVRIGARLGRRTSARSHRPDKDSRTIRRPLKDQPVFTPPPRKRNASQIDGQESRATTAPSANRYCYSTGMAPAPFGFAATSVGMPGHHERAYQVCHSENNNPSVRDLGRTEREGQTMAPSIHGNHWQHSQIESQLFHTQHNHSPNPDQRHNQQSNVSRTASLPLSTPEYLTSQILSPSMNPSRDLYMGTLPLSTQEYLRNQILSTSINPSHDSYMGQTGIRIPVSRPNISNLSYGQGNRPFHAPNSSNYQSSDFLAQPHIGGFRSQEIPNAEPVSQFGIPVLEREMDHNEWAIRRSLPGEDPKCSAYVDRNGRWESCGRPLKTSTSLSVAAPSFYGTCEIRFTKSFQIFWFCPRSASGCVGSDHVLHMRGGKSPKLPRIWPVDVGTKLNNSEANELGRAGFLLVDDASVEEQLKLQQIEFASNVSPMNPLRRPPRRAGKKVNRRSLTDSGECRRENGLRMAAHVRVLSQCREDSVFTFNLHTVSTTTNKPVNYVITISETPSCTCPFFVNSVSDHKPGHFYMTCKHMYHIYNRVLGLPLTDERPHQATLSRAEVEDIMKTWRPNHSLNKE